MLFFANGSILVTFEGRSSALVDPNSIPDALEFFFQTQRTTVIKLFINIYSSREHKVFEQVSINQLY